MEHQDWDTATIYKRGGSKKKTATVAAARSGAAVTSKKYDGGKNKSAFSGGAGAAARRIEEESEDFRIVKVDLSLRKAIAQARNAKGWKQKDLAQRIMVKPSVVNDYESGKAVPNGMLISKMERALGVKLPRPSKKKKNKK